MKRKLILRTSTIIDRAVEAMSEAIRESVDGEPVLHEVIIREHKPRRSTDQNEKMWPMLHDLSDQIMWHGVKLSPEEWKDFATATLEKQKFVPDLDGMGFIAVGGKTSSMTMKKFADLIEILYLIGARNDVVWSEPNAKD